MMKQRDATSASKLVSNQAHPTTTCSTPESVEFLDPLDPDLPSDLAVTLSHRQLGRLVFIAAETGARFEREGANVDPVGWLFAPRDLFNGRQAIVACKEREPFVSAIILHGLSIGFDADPNEIDALMSDDGKREINERALSEGPVARPAAIAEMSAS